MRSSKLELLAIEGLPVVTPGDDLARLAIDGLARSGLRLAPGDVLVIAQKIVSKAEGRMVVLADVTPSARALQLGRETKKDPRLVELILSETKRIVRSGPDVLIVEHRLGFVMANAGVDQSNVGAQDGIERALLLPLDPDASAEALRSALSAALDVDVGVVINDSFGRAWRLGTVGVALGVAGLPALNCMRRHAARVPRFDWHVRDSRSRRVPDGQPLEMNGTPIGCAGTDFLRFVWPMQPLCVGFVPGRLLGRAERVGEACRGRARHQGLLLGVVRGPAG